MTKEELKNKVSDAKINAEFWYNRNKHWVKPVVSGCLAVSPFAIRFGMKRFNLNKEQKLKDLYIYDRSHGHYWELRRKLSTREMLEIDRRKDNGESLVDILESMRVLK